MMKSKNTISITFLFLLVFSMMGARCKKDTEETPKPPVTPEVIDVTAYLSYNDGSSKFQKQDWTFSEISENGKSTIVVDAETQFQEIDGFGYTLTGGSAMLLKGMSDVKRSVLLNELFGTQDNQIGVSYLRISIGASDLDSYTFSYNDLPPGETDVDMTQFSLAPDQDFLIPVLKEILAINPSIKILGSPWSPPVWMKTNNATKGGELKEEFYQAYANYFVKYVQEMAQNGIIIDAITIQNEPLHPGNNPSLYMPALAQANFIKTALGPTFEANGIKTKIILYDHNADKTEYPISILDDPEAKKYVNGSGFHLYGGDINNLSKVHNAHPDRSLYFTEQWIGAPGNFGEDLVWHTNNLIIGATRNWCRNVLEWNLASDPNLGPHTEGGCTECLGALTIDNDDITRNPAYYIIAHASKFVRPGSVRLDSNVPSNLNNVAFSTPDGKTVVVVINNADSEQEFNMQVDGKLITSKLASKAVATYVYTPEAK
ncbi:glycoside hydrolase family 30 protein [Saccharicrinis aurantiacus]|uniref:glycoside hydrolase family 30 protein n=1 Tax=Saccharicrinis aurantiacus TaxID=1849719 RepID=UPI002492C93C|nr:glycoside hydrolase family 30 beta sandwich domain-containing protein [Saccharicrinis aurantiacus]